MKNIPYYKVRKIKNIKELVNDSCRIYSENTAYLIKKDGRKEYEKIKYKKVKKDVDALGTALIELGLKNKKIAIIGENRYEWAISYLSIICGTGIVVPLDKQLPEQEIKNCIERADVSAIIYSSKLNTVIEDIKKDLKTVKKYICMDKVEEGSLVLSIPELLERGETLIKNGNTKFINSIIDEEGMAELLFTSGTTQESKAVMLSHKNICFNIYEQCKMLLITQEDVFLSILPIHHTYECTCGFLTPLYRGSCVAYCEGLKHIQKNMQEAKVTVFLAVPLIFETLYRRIWQSINKKGKASTVKKMIAITNFLDKFGIKLKRKIFNEIHEQLGGKIKAFIAGAAGINPEVSKGFRDFGILAVQGYGLSECAPIVALNRDVDYKDGAARFTFRK